MTMNTNGLLALADAARVEAGQTLDHDRRSEMGQFMTPAPIAAFMASMFRRLGRDVRLLDAGAGVGSLTAAFVAEACARSDRPSVIEATTYEVDPTMLSHLRPTLDECERFARSRRMRVVQRVVERDFIEAGSALLDLGSYGDDAPPRFNAAILNPPYRKIHSQSSERATLRAAGIETSNLYTAFVSLAIMLLEPDGELVAITPRSFCNGPYFRPFRQLLLREMALLQVHVFESRSRAFKDDSVLQENIIFHARKSGRKGRVTLSTSEAPGAEIRQRKAPYDLVVNPEDPNAFIHLAVSDEDAAIAERMRKVPCSLHDLGLQLSTGRVVDFRAREYLRKDPGKATVPLIYPAHFEDGFVAWPRIGGRKPNALAGGEATQGLMVPSGTYVLTKRFTSKEERRRVVAAVYDADRLPDGIKQVGFENHINYFHINGGGLRKGIAKGLAAYLNSSLVDLYFRQFNGHTQVNAGDLRSIRYPTLDQLKVMGKRIGTRFPSQERTDAIVDEALD
jgi:adenine-specific DNA-methyltransferase